MTVEEENSLILKLCKFGMTHKAFMIGEFYSTITDLTKDDKRFIENMLIDWGGTPDPNHILTFGKNPVSYQIASGQQKTNIYRRIICG